MSYFNRAWQSMSETKPLPKKHKRTCYNYKCKFLKQWVFDERSRMEAERGESLPMGATMNKSVHESALEREMQESKLISTMALSGVVA